MILAALVLAASVTSLDMNGGSVFVVSKPKGGHVTVTVDGQPMSCLEFNHYLAGFRPRPVAGLTLDCKTGKLINLPKQ